MVSTVPSPLTTLTMTLYSESMARQMAYSVTVSLGTSKANGSPALMMRPAWVSMNSLETMPSRSQAMVPLSGCVGSAVEKAPSLETYQPYSV